MNDPKIDHKGVDWRSEVAKVEGGEYSKLRDNALTQIGSFRELRKILGLTQIEVAQILEMTQSNVSKIETKLVPNLEVLRSLVDGHGKVRVIVELDRGDIIEFAA